MEQELICRTCLSNTSKCISIYTMPSLYGKSFTISKMIMACAPVEISEDDGLPCKICDNCLKYLQISFMFRIRVLQANKKLKDYLQTKLVPNLQPVSGGFIEPLLPSTLDEEINKLFSWERVVQDSNDNKTDPLFVDPLLKLIEQSGIKTEPENEILPIEEVILPTNTTNFLAEKTDELSCDIPYITKTQPLISERSANLLIQSPPVLNWINKSTNEQQNNSNLNNTESEYNSNVLHLTEADTIFLQNILQSDKNTKYILIKANNLTAETNTQIESYENVIKNNLCEQNSVLPSSSQSYLQSTTSNKNDNLSNNTFPNVKLKPKKQSFEDELKKFVEDRQKYLEHRKEDYENFIRTYPPKRKITEPSNIDNINIVPPKQKITEPFNTDNRNIVPSKKNITQPSNIDNSNIVPPKQKITEPSTTDNSDIILPKQVIIEPSNIDNRNIVPPKKKITQYFNTINRNIVIPTKKVSKRSFIYSKNTLNNAVISGVKKRKNPEPPASIDLTSDDEGSEDVLPIKHTNTTTNVDTSQDNSNVSTCFKGITFRHKDNKIVRLMIDDQSSCILID